MVSLWKKHLKETQIILFYHSKYPVMDFLKNVLLCVGLFPHSTYYYFCNIKQYICVKALSPGIISS